MVDDSRGPVVGFLSADLQNGASALLWPAVVHEARSRGVNLISFPGGPLGRVGGPQELRNKVYDLAGPRCLDAVITWASTLGSQVETETLEGFHDRLRGLPMVSLSQKLAGIPSIQIDAYNGMCELINHLIQDHGFRRIAFIRGPVDHQPAQIRYQAYRDVLGLRGVSPNPALEVGPLPWEAGAEAVKILLDERGLVPGRDFEALASASDMVSLGAFKALKARGYRIPKDVALVGCNGTVESVLSQPPMTTVMQPFAGQGRAAVTRVLDLLAGRTVEPHVDLPSRLVIRASCGCPVRSADFEADQPRDEVGCGGLESLIRRWLDRVEALEEFQPDQVQAWFEPLGAAVAQDLSSPAERPRVLEILDLVLTHAVAHRELSRSYDWAIWQDVISLIGTTLGPGVDAAGRRALWSLIDLCRVKISAFIEQDATTRRWDESQRAEILRETGRVLSTAWSISELTEALEATLPRLEIPGAWFVLQEDPVTGPVSPTGTLARLAWVLPRPGPPPLPPGGLLFPQEELIPRGFLPLSGPWSLVVEPLVVQTRSVGFLVFQTGPVDGAIYDELRSSLGSTLKGIFLMAEVGRARQLAEKADQIKTRLLANVSHELRTPLAQILHHVQAARALEPTLGSELDHIQGSAEHQLRLINDLLDLSRAEIDELDLSRELLNPGQLISEVFAGFAHLRQDAPVKWVLDVADRLPFVLADALRLKQVLLNLLSNASKFTATGTIEIGARSEPPSLHIWVKDTGPGIANDVVDRIFEPFAVGDHGEKGGIGLGLSIARHLVALHYGSLTLETAEGQGTTFHLRLPLPNLENSVAPDDGDREPVVVVLTRQGRLPPDLEAWVAREHLTVVSLGQDGDETPRLAGLRPRCFCWDLTDAQPRDWALVRQLRHHPGLFQAPFLLYGDQNLTILVDKSDQGTSLQLALEAACPPGGTRPIFVVDDEEPSRQAVTEVIHAVLPGYPVRAFGDGESAWAALGAEVPGLVVLDFAMPGWNGADVLDKIRSDSRLRLVPVLLLSHKVFSSEDIARIEKHALVTLQTKGIWDSQETGEALVRMFSTGETPPVHTSALVKRALNFMTAHFQEPLSRWQVAEAVHVSEDYLSRIFSRELGLSPRDFLNRYRIQRACRYLRETNDSIGTIGIKVGFNDQAYFSRVFRKTLNCTPQEFRQRV